MFGRLVVALSIRKAGFVGTGRVIEHLFSMSATLAMVGLLARFS